MPHAAAGIGLGILAAGAITAILAKEVIENWDEISDRYEHFADRMEDEHDLFLPRFRDRRYAFGAGRAHSGSFARDHNSGATSTGYSRRSHQGARRTHEPRPIPYSERFRDVTEPVNRVQTPPNAYQDPDEDEDEDFKAAIEASLLDMTLDDSHDRYIYEAPMYPKLELDTSNDASRVVQDPFADSAASNPHDEIKSEMLDFDDVVSWTGSWTNTEPSVPSEEIHDEEWSDSETSFGGGHDGNRI